MWWKLGADANKIRLFCTQCALDVLAGWQSGGVTETEPKPLKLLERLFWPLNVTSRDDEPLNHETKSVLDCRNAHMHANVQAQRKTEYISVPGLKEPQSCGMRVAGHTVPDFDKWLQHNLIQQLELLNLLFTISDIQKHVSLPLWHFYW